MRDINSERQWMLMRLLHKIHMLPREALIIDKAIKRTFHCKNLVSADSWQYTLPGFASCQRGASRNETIKWTRLEFQLR